MKSIRKLVTMFPVVNRFVLILSCALLFSPTLVSVRVQAQETSKPEATPSPKPDQKNVRRNIPASTIPTGTIKGRVVSEDGHPITNATIMAAGFGMMSQKGWRVDADGKFVLNDLPAAPYVIMAIAPGYIDPSLLEEPNERSRALVGSQLKIVMVKGGAITGTIKDSKGQPVVGVPLSALPLNDSSVLTSYIFGMSSATESDDRGIYRIFGLPPGQYTVAAGGGGPFGKVSASGFDLDVPTYYPSATRDTALAITVRAGEETSGIDIRYRDADGYSIRGTVPGVIDSNAALGTVTIVLAHAGTSSVLSFGLASAVDQRRAFEFNGVGDGEYDILAMFQSGPTEEPLVGTKRVNVRGADVTGIEINLSRFASIFGALALDEIKPDGKCDKRGSQLLETAILTPRDGPRKSGGQVMTQLFGAFGGTLNAKGEFAMGNLETGRYRLAITLPTEAWYVRKIAPPATSTQQRPTDSWQGVITLKSGERAGPFSITIGQNAASLRGRIDLTSEGSTTFAGLRVHLVPIDREEANNILRYSETVVGNDGSFGFTNIAPGRYLIAAISQQEELVSTTSRPAALDPTMRSKVRHEAETANMVVDLKPCQQLVDYKLALKAGQ